MKKLIKLLLPISFVFSLTACDDIEELSKTNYIIEKTDVVCKTFQYSDLNDGRIEPYYEVRRKCVFILNDTITKSEDDKQKELTQLVNAETAKSNDSSALSK